MCVVKVYLYNMSLNLKGHLTFCPSLSYMWVKNLDANKLECALRKSIASKVIEKRYEIIDIEGLVEYLKTCNVDPQIFKSFIDVIVAFDELYV